MSILGVPVEAGSCRLAAAAVEAERRGRRLGLLGDSRTAGRVQAAGEAHNHPAAQSLSQIFQASRCRHRVSNHTIDMSSPA